MAIEAAKLMVVVDGDTDGAERKLNRFDSRLKRTAQSAGVTGALLTAGVTAPLLAVGAAGLTVAGQYEQTMNVLQQVTGASAEEMSRLSEQAIHLGAVTSFSAGESADAMLELAKAGMTTEQVMQSISGVLDLAAAGGVGLGRAAEITASGLNAFGLEAAQSATVANLLAAAANASAADITDLAQGLQQGGFAFAAAGQDIDDLAASLAILTNVGLTGSDAGTALKNAMTRIMSPTQEAKTLMDELNLSFYDTNGQMLQLPEIIGVLNTALAGMTQEQRNATLETLFLSDGMKAMIPLLTQGVDGFNQMLEAVNQEGAAASVADARMSGLAGAIEYLSGSVESFLINESERFLGFFSTGLRRVGDFVTRIGELPQPVKDAALAFMGVLAAAGPALLAIAGISTALSFLVSPMGLVIVGLGLLAAAWAGNFADMRGKTDEAWQAIQPTLESMQEKLGGVHTAALLLWEGLSGDDNLADMLLYWGEIDGVFGKGVADRLYAAADAMGRWRQTMEGIDLAAASTQIRDFIGQLDQLRARDLLSGGFELSTRLVAGIKTDIATQVNWGAIKVDAAGLVARVGQQLAGIEWAEVAVNAEGLLSHVANTIQAQSEKYLGADNLIGRSLDRFSIAANTLQSEFGQADLSQPVSALHFMVLGLATVAGALGSIRADALGTGIAALHNLVKGVLGLSSQLVSGVDPAVIQRAAIGFINGFAASIATAFDVEEMAGLGAAVGTVGVAITTKLGETLRSESFASELGIAVGTATGAFLEGAGALVSGVMGQMSEVDFAAYQTNLDAFTQNFVTGTITGLATADWSGMGDAVVTGLKTAIRMKLETMNLLDLVPGPMGALLGNVGGTTGLPTFGEMYEQWQQILPAFSWETVIPALTWSLFVSQVGWSDFVDPLSWATFVTDLAWGTYISDLLWSAFIAAIVWDTFVPSMAWSTYVANITWGTYVPDVRWSSFVPVIDWGAFIPRLFGGSGGGGGSSSGGGTNTVPSTGGGGGSGEVPERTFVDPGSGSVSSAGFAGVAAASAIPPTNINVYATVADELDINELALRIAETLRRRGL